MRHRASPKFWRCYNALPAAARQQADKCFELLKANPRHPSLHFKRVGEHWSVRVGDSYRSLGIDDEPDGIYWIWIGTQAEYDRIIS